MKTIKSTTINQHLPVLPTHLFDIPNTLPLVSLEKCLKGGWLKKWPRSLPLYTDSTNNSNTEHTKCLFGKNDHKANRWYSCQGRIGAHKRFFWISQLNSGQWALRWKSNRKRLSESLIILATVNSITLGKDIEYLNSQTTIGCNINCIFTISGDASMQLEADDEQSANEWITAISIVTYASRANLLYPCMKGLTFSLDDKSDCLKFMKQMDIISNPARCRPLWHYDSGFSGISLPKIPPNNKNPSENTNLIDTSCIEGVDNTEKDGNRTFDFYKLLSNVVINNEAVHTLLLQENYIDYPKKFDSSYHLDHISNKKGDADAPNYGLIGGSKYQDFLSNIQKSEFLTQGASLLNIQSLISPFISTEKDEKICKLTTLGFYWLLTRSENSILSPISRSEIESEPLSQFIVASSHNTYLIGDQIGGSAEPSGLASALLRGCRCIELDIQDGPDGEPRLYHSLAGYKLSGYFTLRESLKTIKTSAFVASKLPVVLSIQMKSSDTQKYTVYKLFTTILGDSLYVPQDRSDLLNTPISKLYNKFIIKAKLFSQYSLHFSPGQKAWEKIVALEGISLSNRENFECKIAPYHVCSMSETHFLRLLKSTDKLKQLSNACFVRLYPSGTRVTSTNFCPLNPWSLGIQFVALNYQSCDRSMLINQGWFSGSDGFIPRNIASTSPIELSLHVLSATQLPVLSIGTNGGVPEDSHLFVTISLVSNSHRSESNCTYRTSTVHVKNDSYDPVWADVTPPIRMRVDNPGYSMLVLQLKNTETIGSGVLIGQASIPIYRILPGIRWVPLLDRRLRHISCSGLLVKAQILPLN